VLVSGGLGPGLNCHKIFSLQCFIDYIGEANAKRQTNKNLTPRGQWTQSCELKRKIQISVLDLTIQNER